MTYRQCGPDPDRIGSDRIRVGSGSGSESQQNQSSFLEGAKKRQVCVLEVTDDDQGDHRR